MTDENKQALEWSEILEPNETHSRYTHVKAKTSLGVITIEWKGWKKYPNYSAITPWGGHVFGDDLEEIKQLVQDNLDDKIRECAALRLENNVDLTQLKGSSKEFLLNYWQRAQEGIIGRGFCSIPDSAEKLIDHLHEQGYLKRAEK